MSEIYIHATLKVRIGGYERFAEAMARQVPVLESYGWKLEGGWVTKLGRVYTVIHIWKLPDANTFFEATAQWRETTAYQEFRAVTADVLEDEVLSLVGKTPYSP